MAIKLFEQPLSPYAQKVKIVLYEKGLPFERVFVDVTMHFGDGGLDGRAGRRIGWCRLGLLPAGPGPRLRPGLFGPLGADEASGHHQAR